MSTHHPTLPQKVHSGHRWECSWYLMHSTGGKTAQWQDDCNVDEGGGQLIWLVEGDAAAGEADRRLLLNDSNKLSGLASWWYSVAPSAAEDAAARKAVLVSCKGLLINKSNKLSGLASGWSDVSLLPLTAATDPACAIADPTAVSVAAAAAPVRCCCC